MSCLPHRPVTGLLPRRPANILLLSAPRADLPFHKTTPPSGRQDSHDFFAVRRTISRPPHSVIAHKSFSTRLQTPSRAKTLVACPPPAHPAFVTMANAPLWGGMAKVREVIWVRKPKYFLFQIGLDTLSTTAPHGQSSTPASESKFPLMFPRTALRQHPEARPGVSRIQFFQDSPNWQKSAVIGGREPPFSTPSHGPPSP